MRRQKTNLGIFVLMGLLVGLPAGVSFAAETPELNWPGQEAGQGIPQEAEPGPEQVAQMMQTMMIPMMGQMMQVMIQNMSEALAQQEIAENFASFTRNFYNALMDRGFTQEEALRIVTSSGFPSVGGAQR